LAEAGKLARQKNRQKKERAGFLSSRIVFSLRFVRPDNNLIKDR